jgi:hypothetical protein
VTHDVSVTNTKVPTWATVPPQPPPGLNETWQWFRSASFCFTGTHSWWEGQELISYTHQNPRQRARESVFFTGVASSKPKFREYWHLEDKVSTVILK